MVAYCEAPFIEVKQENHVFLLTRLSVEDLTLISYASVRGSDHEEGAVQRALSARRIGGIKEFALQGGDFPAGIVLNWVNDRQPIERTDGTLRIPLAPKSAQLIDGQHRVAGLREARLDSDRLGSVQIPVVIYQGLKTRDCANLFLAINTEQKPVSPSLVYDLYDVADGPSVDPAADRARDIVMHLHDDKASPYYEQIKLPGAPRRRGGVQLSTAVSAIKPLVEKKGAFEQRGLTELETQKKLIANLFIALRNKYGESWDQSDNVFHYAAGFTAAIHFLRYHLLDYCLINKNFNQKFIGDAIVMLEEDLITQHDVRKKSGKEAIFIVCERLIECFEPKVSAADLKL